MSAPSSVLLKEILPEFVGESRWQEVAVSGLSVDSRQVKKGDCFLACPGHAADGRRFIADALAKGAAVVVAEAEGLSADATQPVVAVQNLKQHLGDIASRFYGNPSAAMQMVAVTGTNGKTTVTHLIAQAALNAGKLAGVIGTLGNGIPGKLNSTANTTPDIVAINAALSKMKAEGAVIVAMEASSHGLVQGRLDGLTLHTGVVTNLSRDHLDYHGSMEAYRDAKALLVRHETLQHLVLNADQPDVMAMAEGAADKTQVHTFSLDAGKNATVVAQAVEYTASGLRMQVRVGQQVETIASSLVGEFNAANLLAAVAAMLTLGFDLKQTCAALAPVKSVPGRMQVVNPETADREPAVVVDFAHTPDALQKVLTAARHHCTGSLWCVFGCGGDRDAGKRPLMGEAVAQFADNMVITADNPRSEKVNKIIADIVKGIPAEHAFEIIEDRVQAVEYAVVNAKPQDLVVLAGKGHEDYQEVAGVKYPYSDENSARQALQKRRSIHSAGKAEA